MPRKKTNEEFVNELLAINPQIQPVEPYRNSNAKIKVKCSVCSHEWASRPADLLRGHSCPRCSGKERKTTNRFREEVASANSTVNIVGKYVNTSTKIEVLCKICGLSWMANPSTLLKGIGCPYCGGTKKKSHHEFISKLARVNPNIEVLDYYKNNHTKLHVCCVKCGHTWYATPHNLIQARSRCPACSHSSTSFMEQFIFEWLSRALGVNYVLHRDLSAIGYELDVYIPSLKLAFEPGSWHWHKYKLVNDNFKRKLCNEKGIRLITIYDRVPEEQMFNTEDIVMYPYDIRVSKNYQLVDMLLAVLREHGVIINPIKINIDEVVNAAYLNSLRTDTSSFIDKLLDKGTDVEVIGTYTSSSSRIQVQCKSCGYTWFPRADQLLSGSSRCRKCGIVKNGKAHLKSHETFVLQLSQRNPSVEVIGHYKKASERIHVRCLICGYEWYPVANTIVCKKPSACPKCGKAKIIDSRIRNKLSSK